MVSVAVILFITCSPFRTGNIVSRSVRIIVTGMHPAASVVEFDVRTSSSVCSERLGSGSNSQLRMVRWDYVFLANGFEFLPCTGISWSVFALVLVRPGCLVVSFKSGDVAYMILTTYWCSLNRHRRNLCRLSVPLGLLRQNDRLV